MPLSMSPSAHYVTQSSFYSSQLNGPLTDRKIARYKKKGYYAADGVLFQSKQKAKRRCAKRRRRDPAKFVNWLLS